MVPKQNSLADIFFIVIMIDFSFEISEKYEQMTVIELPHKAPTIRSDVAISQYEVRHFIIIIIIIIVIIIIIIVIITVVIIVIIITSSSSKQSF